MKQRRGAEDGPGDGRLTRRAFITGLGGATAYVVLQGPRWRGLLLPTAAQPSNATPVRVLSALRREDMLNAVFRFYDVSFSTITQGSEGFSPAGANPTVVVELPPQAIGEEAFITSTFPAANTRARALLAGNTRLAFIVEGTEEFSAQNLLDWWQWRLRITPSSGPSSIETAVEAPWGLVLSPRVGAPSRFVSRAPLTRSGITGLWYGELTYVDEDGFADPTHHNEIAAVEARTLVTQNNNDLFELPLTPTDRTQIRNATLNERAVRSNTMLVSPMGAWLDVQGDWSGLAAGAGGLTHWRHRSTMGRDHLVRVIRKGYLFPFGHRAVEVTVSERKIAPDGRAYLVKRAYLVVKQPVIDYDASAPTERFGGRAWPFRQVRLVTLGTPDLKIKDRETVSYTDYAPVKSDDPYWVQALADGKDVRFTAVATDWDGNEVTFTVPMMFAKISSRQAGGVPITYEPFQWLRVINTFFNQPARSTIKLGGQRVAVAPSSGGAGGSGDEAGGASYHAETMRLSGAEVAGVPGGGFAGPYLRDNDLPAFHPEIEDVDIRIDQVEVIAGTPKPAKIGFNQTYLADGYGVGNPKGLFADVLSDVGVTFPVDKTGGLAAPNLSVAALTRDLGPVGDVASFLAADPLFDPERYFPKIPTPDMLLPKLLGDIQLPDVLETGDATTAPKIKTVLIYPDGNRQRPPVAQTTTLDWVPILKDFPESEPVFKTRDGAKLEIHGLFASKLSANAQPTSDINGLLKNFDLIVGPIHLIFDQITFASKNGAKPEIDVDIIDVVFTAPLTFVNEFRELMKKSPDQPGLSIDVNAQRIAATYNLAIPDMAVGIFAMKNLSLRAGVNIPLKGDDPMSVTFDFGRPDDPFLVAYTMFAGSGYFGVEITPKGIRSMSASIGFGATIAFDIKPVVSGSVSIMAGIRFTVRETETGKEIELAGYLTVKGTASAMGLVTVTIMLFLEFVYEPIPNKITATGVLTIEVDITLVSKTITKTVTYSFGSGADPTLAQAWTPADWDYYADSFETQLT